MSISNLYTLVGIASDIGALNQISSARMTPASQMVVHRGAGVVNPHFVALQSQDPVVSFECSQIAKLLALGTVIDLSGDVTHLQYQAGALLGVRTSYASSAHYNERIQQCMLIVDRITCTHRGLAMADCRLIIIYDGINEPVVPVASVALSGSFATEELFTLGFGKVNGTTLAGVSRFVVEFGHEVNVVSSDGEPWPTFAGLRQSTPSISIEMMTPYFVPTVGLDGLALDGANGVDLWMRKKASDGVNETSGGVRIQTKNGIIRPSETAGGGDNSAAGATFTVTPRAIDETNDVFVFDTSYPA